MPSWQYSRLPPMGPLKVERGSNKGGQNVILEIAHLTFCLFETEVLFVSRMVMNVSMIWPLCVHNIK